MSVAPRTPSTLDLEALVRPAVREIPSYVPAKIPAGAPARQIKLDMNESPYGPSPKARAALAAFDHTHRYPDFTQADLRAALGQYVGAPADQISCGAGLDDVLTNLMVLLLDPGDEVIISEPTFGVYRSLIAVHGGVTVDVPLTDGFQLDVDGILSGVTERTKLIIICNPNNPTGNTFDPASVEQIVAEAPCLVGIDEAYAEFAGISHLPLMDRYPNVCCLRTLSKFAGLAGMRVGYGVFPKPLMPYLWAVTPAFCNVSLASSVAAVASLDDLDYLNGIIARLNADRDALADNLREIPGVEPLPSSTNFILMRLPVSDATPVIKALAERGIFVRNFPKPSLGIADCLRVSIGTAEENEIFLGELDDALQRVRGAA